MSSQSPAAQQSSSSSSPPSLFELLPADWRAFLALDSSLTQPLECWYATLQHDRVFPARDRIFHAFEFCPVEQVKVIILGQDPYHTPGQANGLAFSCETEGRVQPSLRNIFAEVVRSVGSELTTRRVQRGDLHPWAEQGVLLLNAVLTVAAGQARSHQGKGWEQFTSHVVYRLLSQKKHLVFMRWGKDAAALRLPPQAATQHLILTASHPSPLSCHVSFEGCHHFAQCNAYLAEHGQSVIQWT